MQPCSHKGIAYTYGVNHVRNIDDRCLQQFSFRPEKTSECVMLGTHHVAHAHHPVLQTGEAGMQLVKPRTVFVQLHLEVGVCSCEGRLRVFTQPLELDGITEHHVATEQHTAQRFTWLGSFVFPEVLAVVDIEADGNPQLISDVKSFEGGIGSLLGNGCGNA